MRYKKIYLKITTVPNQLEVDIDSKEIEIFRNKYESHKSFIKDSDVELAYLNESAVNGSFARIYSITLGFMYEGNPVVKTMYGEENDLLDKLLSVLRHEDFADATVVMYNRSFILSFISKRLRKYNYPISLLPVSLQSFDKKTWTISGSKCIQEYVKGISYQTENFSETCFIHGLDPNIIEGSDVARYIKKEQLDIVHQSDLSYVFALMQIDRQLSEKDALKEFNGIVEKVGEVVKEDVNVLDHILSSGNLCNKTLQALKDFADSSGEPKENILTLTLAALSKTKEYQKVPEEDIETLKEALDLKVDYSKIQQISEKGNMGAKECKALIKEYQNKTDKEKQNVVDLVIQFLTEKNKINQKRTGEALKLLKSSLLT